MNFAVVAIKIAKNVVRSNDKFFSPVRGIIGRIYMRPKNVGGIYMHPPNVNIYIKFAKLFKKLFWELTNTQVTFGDKSSTNVILLNFYC